MQMTFLFFASCFFLLFLYLPFSSPSLLRKESFTFYCANSKKERGETRFGSYMEQITFSNCQQVILTHNKV